MSDPWLLGDGLRLCYMRSSVSMHGESDSGDLLSRAQTQLVTAPPTLTMDELLGRMPLIAVISDKATIVDSVRDEHDTDTGGLSAADADGEVRTRAKALLAASFEHRSDLSNDIVALARQFTVADWRDAFLQSRSFALPHLMRLCELCADSEALFDAVLTHVLPSVANSCVLDDGDDAADVPALPHDVSLLLDAVARRSSLRRVPLAQLSTHALLQPLNAPTSGSNNCARQLFRQRILQCSVAASISGDSNGS
jgi:hypothetical protein